MWVNDVLHALPESFGFTDLPDCIDGTVELGIGTSHSNDLEFPTNDIEWMGEKKRGSACDTPACELSQSQFCSIEGVGRR